MPYYTNLKILFVHIPKTGGTSISSCLEKNEKLVQKKSFDFKNAIRKKLFRKKNYEIKPFNFKHAIAEKMLDEIGTEKNNYKKFTIVRNPWDLVVSFYFHLRKPLSQTELFSEGNISYLNPVEASMNACKMDFKSWVKIYYDPYLRPRQIEETRFPYPVSHFYKQLDWITNINGEILVDKILKFEEPNEWKNYLKGLGLKDTNDLDVKLNSSKRRVDYKYYYDDEIKNIIGQYFKKDIDKFDYKF